MAQQYTNNQSRTTSSQEEFPYGLNWSNQESGDGVWYVRLKYQPLIKTHTATRNIDAVRTRKNELISRIDEDENAIKNIAPNVQILSKHHKVITGIILSIDITSEELDQIRSLPNVANVEYNPPIQLHMDEAIPLCNVPQAQNLGDSSIDGTGVKLVIIDLGFNPNHPDFASNFNAELSGTYWSDGLFSNEINETSSPGHGTHCASIAAGTGEGSGQQGVAPGADLIMWRAYGLLYTPIITAVENTIDLYRDDTFVTADVVSMSWGSTGSPWIPSQEETESSFWLYDIMDCSSGGCIIACEDECRQNGGYHLAEFCENGSCDCLCGGGDMSGGNILSEAVEKASIEFPNVVFISSAGNSGPGITGPMYGMWAFNSSAHSRMDYTSYLGSFGWSYYQYPVNIHDQCLRYDWEENGFPVPFGYIPEEYWDEWADGGSYMTEIPPYGGEYMNVGCPACGPNVIAVGATQTMSPNSFEDNMAPFSSVGPSWPTFHNCISFQKPDIVAPGYSICAADGSLSGGDCSGIHEGNELLMEVSGTSMAAPFVAGAVALMKQTNPLITSNQVKQILQQTAEPITEGNHEAHYDYLRELEIHLKDVTNVIELFNFSDIMDTECPPGCTDACKDVCSQNNYFYMNSDCTPDTSGTGTPYGICDCQCGQSDILEIVELYNVNPNPSYGGIYGGIGWGTDIGGNPYDECVGTHMSGGCSSACIYACDLTFGDAGFYFSNDCDHEPTPNECNCQCGIGIQCPPECETACEDACSQNNGDLVATTCNRGICNCECFPSGVPYTVDYYDWEMVEDVYGPYNLPNELLGILPAELGHGVLLEEDENGYDNWSGAGRINVEGAVQIALNFLEGCTDSNACNYNPDVNLDDGSCIYCEQTTCYEVDGYIEYHPCICPGEDCSDYGYSSLTTGDVTGDDVVDILDIIATINYIVGNVASGCGPYSTPGTSSGGGDDHWCSNSSNYGIDEGCDPYPYTQTQNHCTCKCYNDCGEYEERCNYPCNATGNTINPDDAYITSFECCQGVCDLPVGELSPEQFDAADMNSDGIVNVVDIIAIINNMFTQPELFIEIPNLQNLPSNVGNHLLCAAGCVDSQASADRYCNELGHGLAISFEQGIGAPVVAQWCGETGEYCVTEGMEGWQISSNVRARMLNLQCQPDFVPTSGSNNNLSKLNTALQQLLDSNIPTQSESKQLQQQMGRLGGRQQPQRKQTNNKQSLIDDILNLQSK